MKAFSGQGKHGHFRTGAIVREHRARYRRTREMLPFEWKHRESTTEHRSPTLDDDAPPVSVQNFRETTTTHERHPFGRLREDFYIIT